MSHKKKGQCSSAATAASLCTTNCLTLFGERCRPTDTASIRIATLYLVRVEMIRHAPHPLTIMQQCTDSSVASNVGPSFVSRLSRLSLFPLTAGVDVAKKDKVKSPEAGAAKPGDKAAPAAAKDEKKDAKSPKKK